MATFGKHGSLLIGHDLGSGLPVSNFILGDFVEHVCTEVKSEIIRVVRDVA